MTDTKAEEPTETAEPTTTPEEKPKRTYTRKKKEDAKEEYPTLTDLYDVDLVDQGTGRDLPLSAATDNLQAVVVNAGGRAILKVAIRNYIGEEPVAVLAKDAGEFGELLQALEDAAVARRKESKDK